LSFNRQERLVVLSLVGIVLVGSGVLIVKRTAPNAATDVVAPWGEAGGADSSVTGPGPGPTPGAVGGHERAGVESGTDAPAATRAKINLNTASAAELSLLPGIGPKRAAAIVEYRARFGRFNSLEDLERVSGIGPGVVERAAPWASVE